MLLILLVLSLVAGSYGQLHPNSPCLPFYDNNTSTLVFSESHLFILYSEIILIAPRGMPARYFYEYKQKNEEDINASWGILS